ncbi:hypothetical protein POM88_033680 [Heracleum sosnowskyi]|uniref:Uncharacterized protein n=1 Tax=Heracleum sosnowskyi TaxID=360622 RepID=A0AAD8HJR6_9APIA|nr:hypothetical protein POM88_033680 [Heracleum sosnowskyi]
MSFKVVCKNCGQLNDKNITVIDQSEWSNIHTPPSNTLKCNNCSLVDKIKTNPTGRVLTAELSEKRETTVLVQLESIWFSLSSCVFGKGWSALSVVCKNCGQLNDKNIIVIDQSEWSNIHTPPSNTLKCNNCSLVDKIKINPTGRVLTAEFSEKGETTVLVQLESIWFSPSSCVFGKGWSALSVAGTKYGNIDLSSDFYDCDCLGGCVVSIRHPAISFQKCNNCSIVDKIKINPTGRVLTIVLVQLESIWFLPSSCVFGKGWSALSVAGNKYGNIDLASDFYDYDSVGV